MHGSEISLRPESENVSRLLLAPPFYTIVPKPSVMSQRGFVSLLLVAVLLSPGLFTELLGLIFKYIKSLHSDKKQDGL